MSTFSLSSVYAQLTSFANLENFWSLFNTAFGSSYDFATAASFRSQWQSQDFSLFPQIEVVSGDVLGSANGAYGISTNRIYLSDQFVSVASQQFLEAVILEEFGHFVDAQVNQTDTQGDEGAIFAELVVGEDLDVEILQALRAEYDHGTITVHGEVIEVEKQDFTGTIGNDNITGTSGDDNIYGLAGDDNLYGLEGNDNIDGENGIDSINGGEGDDTIASGKTGEIIDGGVGNDILTNLDLGDVSTDLILDLASSNQLTGDTNTTINNFETIGTVITGSGNDTFKLTGNLLVSNGKFNGGTGNDNLIADFTPFPV